MTERRSLKRFDIELPLLIEGTDTIGKLFEEATNSLNISSHETYFFLTIEAKKENRLQAIISLPNK